MQFALNGEARQARIEIYSPGGELVFESGEITGQTVVWNLLDRQRQPVADGIYIAMLTITNGPGDALKRIEQVTVARGAQPERQPNVKVPAAPNAPKVEGSGTPGRIPKWVDATLIGDSVISENAGKIGIGQLSPAATLHVTGEQPAVSIDAGANAIALLQLSGGKGGNTTGAGVTAGAGADVSLLAGNGGDAPAGGVNGRGGGITLQPGSPGAGTGAAGQTGNVLLAPFGGNVGVGAANPGSKLTVDGTIQMTGGGSGLKFPDNTIQTTAAAPGLAAVTRDATLNGDGTVGSPLGVANQGVGAAQLANGAVSGVKIAAGQVVKSLNGLTDDLTLAAGSNVTITPSGNTLTIAAAGASNLWSLAGNAGTNPSGNFLGTTDNQPLIFRVNNAEAMRVNTDGNLAIGATNAGLAGTAGLTVAGNDIWKSSIGILNTGGGLEWRLGSRTDGSFIITKITGTTFTPFRAFSNGNAEILTNDTPGAKLTVNGLIENLSGGVKFPDGTTQTTAAIAVVAHDATLAGSGAGASPLGVADQGVNTAQLANGAVTSAKIATPLALAGSDPGPILSVTNSGGGAAINATGAVNTSAQYNIGGDRVVSISGVNNIFAGKDAGLLNTTGRNNAFFGTEAGLLNTTGERNAFFGTLAGSQNTTGAFNAFFGTFAGQFNTASANAFFGHGAGGLNTTGANNAFFGDSGGALNTTGADNAFFGAGAGAFNKTGARNAFFGFGAGQSNTTEFNNTFVGALSDGAPGITNATAIGAGAVVTQSNSVALGNNASVGIGTPAPRKKLHIEGGDVYVGSPGQGVILKSPDGATCRMLTIDNAGALMLTAVACP
jgi:hypothetical protein